ncbi:M10 family metallopeptidase C-terminal domain-containing protein, partial [Roseibium sp. SCP14]|uniref:M10 family metallopeptidase C-terminal domain-containing protein n=1 Tax=Roseibium sp. SCP14 TaxID=3141375 RepID=UPI0033390CC5
MGMSSAAYIETADAADNVGTSYTMSVGDTFSGEISDLNDVDWIRIELSSDETYAISLTGSLELIDTWLTIFDADGSLVAMDDDAGEGYYSYLNFVPTASGTYYVSVASDQGFDTGSYDLSVETRDPLPEPLFTDTETDDAPDNTTTNYNLLVGDSFAGVIDDTGSSEADWVRISLEAGETYAFTLDNTSAYLTLSNFGGVYLTEGQSISSTGLETLIYTAYSTGDYYLGVSSPAHSSFSGSYELTTQKIILDENGDAAASTATTSEMSVGETFTGVNSNGFNADWIRIYLEADNEYDFDIVSHATDNLALRLRDSAGTILASDPPNGTKSSLEASVSYVAPESGYYYLDVDSIVYENTSYYELSASRVGNANDRVADYLSSDYWGGQFAFDVAPGGFLTVDITGLTAAGQYLATNALEAWTAVTGINFSFVSSGAQITFDDNNAGAYAEFFNTGSTITSADINISTGWLDTYGTSLGSYSFQTYIHEIGHALGLGHAGNYDETATYGIDNLFANDSWQASVMSYFDQTENTNIDASFAYLLTPMIADILAIQQLYGTPNNIHLGDTTYGFNSTASGYLDSFVNATNPIAGTIVDNGGTDTLDFSGFSADQVIDLREEQASNIGGLVGNFFIARGTVMENAIGGSGADQLIGNDANNILEGRDSSDTLQGNGGDDILIGGTGDDALIGGTGNDTLIGGTGNDTFDGGADSDTVTYENVSGAVKVDIRWNGRNVGSSEGKDSFTSIENVTGSGFNDW